MNRAFTGFTAQALEPLLCRFVAVLRLELGDHLSATALFGSVARGSASKDSDVDVLVVVDERSAAVDAALVRSVVSLRRTDEYRAWQAGGVFPDPALLTMDRKRLSEHPWILLDLVDEARILWDPEALLRTTLDAVRERMRELGSRRVALAGGGWYWDVKPGMLAGEAVAL